MNVFRMGLIALIGLAVLGCVRSEINEKNAETPAARIGIHDSRAITVAAVGSKYYTHHIKPLEDAFRKAKDDGNEERIKELEPQVWARRKQTHRQGFSTAPVDNILEYIKDDLPNIAQKAGVTAILSNWDKEALSKYKSAERIDITLLLIEAFKPDEKTLKTAIEIQKKPPMSLKELEKHMASEGH